MRFLARRLTELVVLPCVYPRISTRALLLLMVASILSLEHANAVDDISPRRGDISGYSWININDLFYEPVARIIIGDVDALAIQVNEYLDEDLNKIYDYRAQVPPRAMTGDVAVAVKFVGSPGDAPDLTYQDLFNYSDSPELISVSPNQHSILPDDFPVKIRGTGVSVNPGLQVYFGDRPATDVTVNDTGELITCIAPPFKGGAYPAKEDIRVVNPSGHESTLSGSYEYTRVVPRVTGYGSRYVEAWNSGYGNNIYIDHGVSGLIQVYFGDIRADGEYLVCCFSDGDQFINLTVPPGPPGLVSVTIINGDGGVFRDENAFTYRGTPSDDFHTADRNKNFRMELSELLRTIQLYNFSAFHCDASGEDGYAPGPGDEDCSPYASDHLPQNWKIDLEELLELIQFYNLLCYQPCPGAPGTYCPPD